MSIAALKQYGRESGMMIRARIEACPIDFVTHSSMATLTPSLGRTRRIGLSFKGAKITQKVDLAKCTVEASGLTLKITDHSQVASVLFACEPEETWMTPGTLDDIGTTLVVASTAGFDASGYLWIDTEAMSYSSVGTAVDADGVTRGTFLGLGRGALGTLAQYHYSAGDASSGRNLRYPSVTNRPATFEGRRVTLYAYGRGDDPQGDGTQFWTGVVLRDPRMSGAEWSISCDPISKVLDAELGGDLGDCRPRGIHYAYDADGRPTFTAGVFRYPNNGTAFGEIPYTARDGTGLSIGPSFEIQFPSATHDGWFETQQDFVDEVQAQLDVGTAGWATSIDALVDEATGGYYFQLRPGFTSGGGVNSAPDGVIVYINGVDIAQTPSPADPEFRWVETVSGERVAKELDTFVTYYQRGAGGLESSGAAPRGTLLPAPHSPPDAVTRANGTLYIDGTAVPTGDITSVQVTNGDQVETLGVYDTDNVERSLLLTTRNFRQLFVWAAGEPPTIKLGRLYEYDPLTPLGTYQVLKAIETTCPEYVNLGIMPVIREGDWTGDVFGAWFNECFGAPALASMRRYTSFKAQKLLDLITPDLQLLGAYLAFDTLGRLTIKRLRPSLETEVPTLRITAFSKGTWPSYERSPYGSLNTWVVQDGYDPIEDKSTGIPFVVRDVTAYGRNPTPKLFTVKPRSVYYGPTTTYEDAADAAQPLLSIYANPYVIVQGNVPLTALDAVLGSAVTVSTSLLPGTAGLRGMSATGTITSREIDLYGATIELEILISLSGAAGYAPSALITSHDMTGDDEYDLTLSADYFRPGETAADHYLVGDSIRVYPFDALPGAGGDQAGTVLSTSGNVVSVNLGGGSLVNLLPAPASVTWTPLGGGAVTTGQADPLGGTSAALITDDSAAAFEAAVSNIVAYVSGSPVRVETWVKKDAAATGYADIRIGFSSAFNDGVALNLATGACSVSLGTAITDLTAVEAVTGWWRVRFSHSGAVGADVSIRFYPARGTTYPTQTVAALGSATVYAPHISYATWTPGASEWVLAFDALGTTTANMKRYGWAADETLRIDFVTDPDRGAFKFSTSG